MLLLTIFFISIALIKADIERENDDEGLEIVDLLQFCGGDNFYHALLGAFGLDDDKYLIVPHDKRTLDIFCSDKNNNSNIVHAMKTECFGNSFGHQYEDSFLLLRHCLNKYLSRPCDDEGEKREFISLVNKCTERENDMENDCMRNQMIMASKIISTPTAYWRGLMCCSFGRSSKCFLKSFKRCNKEKRHKLLHLWGVGNPQRESKLCSGVPANYDCENPTPLDKPLDHQEAHFFRFISALSVFVLDFN